MSDYIKYEVWVASGGDKFWRLNGQRHNEDGPAIEFSDGAKHWYLNDIQYTESEHKEEMARRNNTCNGKIITIEGKEYELTEVTK